MILVLSLVGLNASKTEKSSGKATLTIRTIGETTEEDIVAGELNLLQILEKSHNIKVSKLGSIRLDCIDGVCAKNGIIWVLYLNDEKTLYSVENYIPKKGDRIKLEYGGIE